MIDDDDLVHILLSRIVSKGKFDVQVESFFNGKEAFDELLKISNSGSLYPDLIFLDINMPLYDGWYLINELEKSNLKAKESIKICMCTSSIAPFDREMAASSKFVVNFIEKPLNIENFQRIINLV